MGCIALMSFTKTNDNLTPLISWKFLFMEFISNNYLFNV